MIKRLKLQQELTSTLFYKRNWKRWILREEKSGQWESKLWKSPISGIFLRAAEKDGIEIEINNVSW